MSDVKSQPLLASSADAWVTNDHTLSGSIDSIGDDRAGRPLSGASVCLIPPGTDDAAECATTNLQGRFFLEARRCGAGARLVASAPGHASKARLIESPSECSHRALLLSLERGGAEVTGIVIDATGGFVPGARVVAYPPSSSDSPAIALSAGDGSFRLSAANGVVELVATAEAYSRATRTLTPPQRDVVLVLAPASTIAGEVVLESGEPLPGAHVMAQNRNGTRAPQRTVDADETGHFVLGELVAGGYEVSAASERFRATSEWVTVAVGERASTRLVAVRASTLRASVDVSGAPCSAGRVTLEGPTGSDQAIDPSGNVRFEGLLRGRYQVSVRCTAVASEQRAPPAKQRQSAAELAEVVVVNQDTVTAHWSASEPEQPDEQHEPERAAATPDQAGSISGRVLDAQGNPVPEAWVTASSANAASKVPSLTDLSGSFVLTGLAPGSYELIASSSLGEGRLSSVPLHSTNVRIQVTLYGAISGTVQSADGTPADAFVLVYRQRNDPDIKSMNGSQGKWSLPWLPAGSYRLSAIGNSGCGWADAQLDAGGKIRVAISLNQSGDVCKGVWRSDTAAPPVTANVRD